MELIGLLFALPLTLVSSTAFCMLVFRVFHRFPQVRSHIAIAASMILCSVAFEIILSLAFGVFALHKHLNLIHAVVHLVNFILAPPAIACVILVRASRTGLRSVLLRIAAIVICWFTCMASLLGNIVVDEAIEGIKGNPPSELK